jgi:hypothetical protein
MSSRKWISVNGLGPILAVIMLLSCLAVVPANASVSTPTANLTAEISTVPTAPLNLIADAGNGFVWLWWNHPSDQGSDLIKNYTIYRNATGSSTNFQIIETVHVGFAMPFNDTNVSNGVAYNYKIVAMSDAGSSPDSNIVTSTPVATATAPGVVQNLVAKNKVYSVQLNWTYPAANGTTPVRYYIVTTFSQFGPLTIPEDHRLPASETGYNDTSVLPGQSYNYTVRAISSTWGEANASVRNFFVGGSGDIPGSPVNLNASGSNNSVDLSWDNPANPSSHGIVKYTAWRSTSASGPFALVGNITTGSIFGYDTTFTDLNVTNGNKYYYQVVSTNSFGSSLPSNIANATPAYEPITPILSASPGNGKVLLAWFSPFNTTSVDIYRSITAGTLGDLMNSSTTKYPFRYYWYDNSTTNGIKYFYTLRANLAGVPMDSKQMNATPHVGIVPAAPTNLMATPDSSGVQLFVSLATTTEPIIGYSIYRANATGTGGEVLINNVSLISSISFSSYLLGLLQTANDNSAVDDVNYTYSMTVWNLFGQSAHSNKATSFASPTGDAPDAVSDLVATPGANQVTLTWNKPTYQGTANVLHYFVFRENGTSWNDVSNGTYYAGLGQQTITDTGLETGTTYQYFVEVWNEYGFASAHSNLAQATTTSSNVNPTAPTAPVSLAATNATAGQIQLTWTAPASNGGKAITSYNIYRGTVAGSESATAIGNSTALTYSDTSVVAGTTYFYVVKAVNSVGVGAASNEASAKAKVVVGVPSAPLGLTYKTGNGYIQLNWTAPTNVGTGITHYRVYRGITASGESATPIAELNGTTLSYNDTTVTNNVHYYYIVKAVNAAGSSDPSSELSVTANVQGSGSSSTDNTLLYAGVGGVVVVAAAAGGFLYMRRKK